MGTPRLPGEMTPGPASAAGALGYKRLYAYGNKLSARAEERSSLTMFARMDFVKREKRILLVAFSRKT